MRILYVIVKALTFPGTLLHALWEHCLCRKFHCTVEDARYFRPTSCAGMWSMNLCRARANVFDLFSPLPV